ncbi:sulfur carrier protein ThiS [Pseudoalteromonas sp. S16_S37]|uniref:sulfur carrier protein ThiS n=1 Tax=Pseudoalteromonas sp. S16_S37 TaxID=2720228 RepID=UPI00167FE452|nr:sulfur carrier protein ThiS [Pseudoalteromonas sp. S16_S37]
MKITFNGQTIESTEHTLQAFIDATDAKEPYAVALNGQFVPRSQCQSTHLAEGDSIELLSPIQGG